MPPCSTPSESQVQSISGGGPATKKALALTLSDLRSCIPTEAFEKSLLRSTWYMLFDYAVWFGVTYGMMQLCASALWSTMPLWQKTVATLVFWNVAGFFMWGIFVVGHDCGHGTFSNFEMVNDILGHIMHGSILVPFYPWQLSHRRHHMYHNHAEKDYSYPWYTPEKLASPEEGMARFLHEHPLFMCLFPFYGWPTYLYGFPDGCHLIPFSEQRMWKDSEKKEHIKCLVSTAVIVAYLVGIYQFFQGDLLAIGYYYFVPWVLFGWWLVTVTYLQHHDPDTVVYNESDWRFVDSAFETVDRVFGFGIDHLHHHITDGHVAHHLFFTKIPHYNLPIATRAIRRYLDDKGNDCATAYKRDVAYDFVFRVHSYFFKNGMKTKMASTVAADAQSAPAAAAGEKKKTK